LILYTPIPLEDVLAEKEEHNYGNILQIPYNGGIIEVEMTSAVTAKIIRLHSHSINDYLQPHFQPGSEIKLKWEHR
jgi:hypothetical protein